MIADELYYVEFVRLVREGGDWTPWIWLQHNEHRVVPFKLLLLLLAGPTRWSQLAEMLCGVGLSALIVLVLWRLHRSSGGTAEVDGLLAFAPVAWLVCSMSQYENQFYGMMVCHYFTALGAVVSLWLLRHRGGLFLALSVLAAVLSAFSIGNGFLVFPAGIAVLATRRAGWGRWAAWCCSGAAAATLYLRDYITPPHTAAFQWTLAGAYRVVKLGLASVGAPLAAGSLAWGLALGTGLLAVSVLLVLRWLRASPARRAQDAVAVGLLLFGLASCAMIAAGRGFMPVQMLGSRYITYSTLAWIGAYFLMLGLAREGRHSGWRIAAWALLVPGVAAAELHGLAEARSWRRERLLDQYVLQTFDRQSDAVIFRLGDPQAVRRAASYLQAERLSAFTEPLRLLMPLNPVADRSMEVLRGRAVIQRLICPVMRLHDVGVVILPAAEQKPGALVVTVTSGGRELGRRRVDTAEVRERTWVETPLSPPLPRCLGRELEVRVDSVTSSPGSGARVSATTPYYTGELRQAGIELPDRRLELALNAFHLGLLSGE